MMKWSRSVCEEKGSWLASLILILAAALSICTSDVRDSSILVLLPVLLHYMSPESRDTRQPVLQYHNSITSL